MHRREIDQAHRGALIWTMFCTLPSLPRLAGCKPKAPQRLAKASWRRRQGCVGLLNDEDRCQVLIRQRLSDISSDWLPTVWYWSGSYARSLLGMAPQRRVRHVQITPSCCPSLCESFPGASDTPQPAVGLAGRRKCTKFPASFCNQHTAISTIARSASLSQKPSIVAHVSFVQRTGWIRTVDGIGHMGTMVAL